MNPLLFKFFFTFASDQAYSVPNTSGDRSRPMAVSVYPKPLTVALSSEVVALFIRMVTVRNEACTSNRNRNTYTQSRTHNHALFDISAIAGSKGIMTP